MDMSENQLVHPDDRNPCSTTFQITCRHLASQIWISWLGFKFGSWFLFGLHVHNSNASCTPLHRDIPCMLQSRHGKHGNTSGFTTHNSLCISSLAAPPDLFQKHRPDQQHKHRIVEQNFRSDQTGIQIRLGATPRSDQEYAAPPSTGRSRPSRWRINKCAGFLNQLSSSPRSTCTAFRSACYIRA